MSLQYIMFCNTSGYILCCIVFPVKQYTVIMTVIMSLARSLTIRTGRMTVCAIVCDYLVEVIIFTTLFTSYHIPIISATNPSAL
jgi:hypothetical protein